MKKSTPGRYTEKRRENSRVSALDPDYAILSELVPQLEVLAAAKPGMVLDFGAGNAPYRPIFSESKYLTADVAQNRSSTIDLIVDRLPLPIENDSVDLILCIYVLEHIRDNAKLLKEFLRILRPGGKLFVATPFMYREHEAPNDFHRPTVFSLAADLSDFGQSAIRKVGNSWFVLYALANELHIKQGERPVASRAGRWFRWGFNRLLLPLLNYNLFARPARPEDSVYHSLFAVATKAENR